MPRGRRFSVPKTRIDCDVGPDYEVLRQIGTGSFSTVWEAIHIATGEQVAIKHITHLFDDKSNCLRFLREISILGSLNHPNVMKLKSLIRPKDLDSFNELYIVTEFARSDLRRLIKSPVHLEEDQIQMIIYNILCAVKFMHSKNVLHRDLKPANILLNDDLEIKICDFGLSRCVTWSKTLSSNFSARTTGENFYEQVSSMIYITSKNLKVSEGELTSHVTTRWYRAPEVILLEKQYSKPIDVWSIGCTIAELSEMLVKNKHNYIDRSSLLPGRSCYPLSPITKPPPGKIENPNQLSLILEFTGTPTDEDISFLTDSKSIKYLRSFKKCHGKNISDILPHTHSAILQLLENMLKFDPRQRITIEDALAHPYFDSIRDPDKESSFDSVLNLEFESEDIGIEELRYYMVQEILKYS